MELNRGHVRTISNSGPNASKQQDGKYVPQCTYEGMLFVIDAGALPRGSIQHCVLP